MMVGIPRPGEGPTSEGVKGCEAFVPLISAQWLSGMSVRRTDSLPRCRGLSREVLFQGSRPRAPVSRVLPASNCTSTLKLLRWVSASTELTMPFAALGLHGVAATMLGGQELIPRQRPIWRGERSPGA